MTFACLRQLLARLAVGLTLAGLLGLTPLRVGHTADAHAAEPSELAGWWIAIDEWWPKIWEGAGIRPMEELLIIDADGQVENRLMQFHTPDAKSCVESGGLICSDAPVVARARIVATDGRLEFMDRVEGRASFFHGEPSLDSRYRGLAASGRPSWTYTLLQGERVLTLLAGKPALTRTFVRIEPDRLRRIRAGLLVAGVAAAEHWRCYLANATATDPSFDGIQAERRHAPEFLDAFLRAASYGVALQDASLRPVPDDTDPVQQALVGAPLERIMIEAFEDIRLPESSVERDRLRSRLEAFSARMRAESVQAKFPLSDGEFTALMRATSPGEEMDALFCLE